MISRKIGKRIFLDFASITPLDKKVSLAMSEVQNKNWANPASLHLEGEEAKEKLETARREIAQILHCRSTEVFFTSGGTESLNLAIFGVVRAVKKEKDFLPHLIVSTIEHAAVLEPIKFLLEQKEIEVSFVGPDENGKIKPESIEKEIKENTVLVVVQHSNNEIGTIQPISKIAKIIQSYRNQNKKYYPYFLSDASQSVCFEDVSIERLQVDLLVLDGIKMYGPRGAGLLIARRNVRMAPMIFGGGQEAGLRSGTENVASAVGLASAINLASKMRKKESERLIKIRDYAIQKILKEFPASSLNGDLENRLPNNINICFATPNPLAKVGLSKIDSEFLVIKLDVLGFAVSAASACHSLAAQGSSYVIRSIGKSDCANSSLRLTLGRTTKKADLDALIVALKKIIH